MGKRRRNQLIILDACVFSVCRRQTELRFTLDFTADSSMRSIAKMREGLAFVQIKRAWPKHVERRKAALADDSYAICFVHACSREA